MRKYVIMGVQGSGKGTQAAMLAADLDLVHISVGDIFRWNVQHHTKMGAQVRRIMAAGELVGDDLVGGGGQRSGSASTTGTTASSSTGSRATGGRPSSSWRATTSTAVIHLDLPDGEVRRRVLARRLCSGCGMDYNLIASSPPGRGQLRRRAAAALVTREDDTEEALAVRLRDYHEKTNPVLDLFRRKEYVVTIDARPGKDEIQQAIREHLHLPDHQSPAAP